MGNEFEKKYKIEIFGVMCLLLSYSLEFFRDGPTGRAMILLILALNLLKRFIDGVRG